MMAQEIIELVQHPTYYTALLANNISCAPLNLVLDLD